MFSEDKALITGAKNMTIIERLQSHTVNIYQLREEDLVEKWVDARLLLHPTRFDLFAKLYYVRNRMDNKAEAVKVYKEHIKAFNPDLKEPGREDKTGYDDFLMAFEALIETFSRTDFDASQSLVPITEDGIILDGAHRVSALAYCNKKVNVAICKGVVPKANFDYRYFKDRGLSWDTMDIIAHEMLQWLPDIYVACLWPKMSDQSQAFAWIEETFGIVYERKVKVNYPSFRKLIKKVYENQPWVNEPNSVDDKSLHCYGFNGQLRFLFFVSRDLDKVLFIKEKIRLMYGVGKHALHITDNELETREIARILLETKLRKEWLDHSAVNSLSEKIQERWYYFKKVQVIDFKVKVAKLLSVK